MSLVIQRTPVPLREDADHVVRVAGTRVTLDTVVAAFQEGATPEEIAQQYPSLRLADVYAVVGYYLQHKEQVDEYLRERQQVAGETRRENESKYSPQSVRARLLAREKRRD